MKCVPELLYAIDYMRFINIVLFTAEYPEPPDLHRTYENVQLKVIIMKNTSLVSLQVFYRCVRYVRKKKSSRAKTR